MPIIFCNCHCLTNPDKVQKILSGVIAGLPISTKCDLLLSLLIVKDSSWSRPYHSNDKQLTSAWFDILSIFILYSSIVLCLRACLDYWILALDILILHLLIWAARSTSTDGHKVFSFSGLSFKRPATVTEVKAMVSSCCWTFDDWLII